MNIVAKMKCETVEPQLFGENQTKSSENVTLRAVYSEDTTSENYSFSCATPTAQVIMNISNKDAWGAFEKGKEYYVNFEPAS